MKLNVYAWGLTRPRQRTNNKWGRGRTRSWENEGQLISSILLPAHNAYPMLDSWSFLHPHPPVYMRIHTSRKSPAQERRQTDTGVEPRRQEGRSRRRRPAERNRGYINPCLVERSQEGRLPPKPCHVLPRVIPSDQTQSEKTKKTPT